MTHTSGEASAPPAGPAHPLLAMDAIEPVSAVSAVTRRLLDFFASGEIQPGDRLPAERQLSASLGVGRSAVREALAALELLGVVTVRPGSGTYLKGTASELLPQTLSWGFMLGTPSTRELIEVRHGLEVQVARLAAQSANVNCDALDATLRTMRDHRSDFDAFVEADMRFHQELAALAGVQVLANLLQTVRSLIRVWVERGVREADEAALTCDQHEAITTAVRAGDPDAAAAAMHAHMVGAKARLLRSLVTSPDGDSDVRGGDGDA